jgi:hypothetical protein
LVGLLQQIWLGDADGLSPKPAKAYLGKHNLVPLRGEGG